MFKKWPAPKLIGVVFILFILIPAAASAFAGCYAVEGLDIRLLHYPCPPHIILGTNIVALVGSLAILAVNFRTRLHSVLLYIVVGGLALLLAGHLYVSLAFSQLNF